MSTGHTRFRDIAASGWFRDYVRPLIAATAGLLVGVSLTVLVGENPLFVLLVILRGAFGHMQDFGMTLFYATPLIATGLAVAVPLRAGLFNIGGEGQLIMGCLGTVSFALAFPGLPSMLGPAAPLAPALAAGAGVLAGAAWGAIAGWLRATRGAHEVITTIMLNFIAAAWASWLIVEVLRSTETQSPESPFIAAGFHLAKLPGLAQSPASVALLLVIAAAVAAWLFMERTRWGLFLRAVGQNPHAANASGISVGRWQMIALTLAGAAAGLVAAGEILGGAHRYRLGFSPDYGFMGIAVALLAKGNPLAVIPCAYLFAALHKGASDLDLETTYVTRDLARIIQAFIIVAVSAERFTAIKGGISRWKK